MSKANDKVIRDEDIIEYIRTVGEIRTDFPWVTNKEIGDALYGTAAVEQELGAARRNSIVSCTSAFYKEGTLDIHHKEKDEETNGWKSFYFWVPPAQRVPHPSATDALKEENERLKAEVVELRKQAALSSHKLCFGCEQILCRPCQGQRTKIAKAA